MPLCMPHARTEKFDVRKPGTEGRDALRKRVICAPTHAIGHESSGAGDHYQSARPDGGPRGCPLDSRICARRISPGAENGGAINVERFIEFLAHLVQDAAARISLLNTSAMRQEQCTPGC